MQCIGPAVGARLEGLAIPRHYEADATIFREGDRSDHVLVIRAGAVRIATLRVGAAETSIGELGPGDLVGEMSAIDGEPRSYDAMAAKPVDALAVSRDDFEQFLLDNPTAALAVLRTVSHRLRRANGRVHAA
jgi:CRP-like cAMP-binding protein